jgi:hypothetical protein
VAWVRAVCVVKKCVTNRNCSLFGELSRHLLFPVYVCVCVCVCTYVFICTYVCVTYCVCMYVFVYVCMYVLCVYMYYACVMYLCVCVCVYVCGYVWIIYVNMYFRADCFTGRTTEEPCFNFHQVEENYFLFRAPRGPLVPIQFLHFSRTGYSPQGVKDAQE